MDVYVPGVGFSLWLKGRVCLFATHQNGFVADSLYKFLVEGYNLCYKIHGQTNYRCDYISLQSFLNVFGEYFENW